MEIFRRIDLTQRWSFDVEHTLHRKLKIGHPVPLKMELRNWKLQIAQIDQGRRRTSNICTLMAGVSPARATRTSIGTMEATQVRKNERNGNSLDAGRRNTAATAHNTSSIAKVPARATPPQTTERTIASPVGAFVASKPQERLRDVTARTSHKDPTAEERAEKQKRIPDVSISRREWRATPLTLKNRRVCPNTFSTRNYT